MPPSQRHLAVRVGMEDEAYAKVTKEENSRSARSARYCPYIIRCRECATHVGNITYLASILLVCYKVENIWLLNDGEKIEMKKLATVAPYLQSLGIEVIEFRPSEVMSSQTHQSSVPMTYCDVTGLTCSSREIDCLTAQTPRNYQRELFLATMRGNKLVYLPTGSGKTLVAAMVFSCMKQLNPGKFMVFIVDRIPLAYQQSAYFQSQLRHLRVATLTGEMSPLQKKDVHQTLADRTVDILVLTHQIFLDNLAVGNSEIRLSNISVLVFDEAHHCNGGHPYNQIMKDFYQQLKPDSLKPLVLGLTASPAGEMTVERTTEKLEKLLKNLHCHVTMPVESDDLVAHVNAPDTWYDVVTTTNTRQIILETLVKDHIEELRKSLIEKTVGCGQLLTRLTVFSNHFRGALRNLIERCHGDKNMVETLIVSEHIMRLLSVVDVNQVLSYKDAIEYLNGCVNSIIQAISPSQSALKRLIGTKQTFVDLKNHAAGMVDETCPMSDRYGRLELRIRKFILRVREDQTSRGIIFVCMRKTAYKLCEKLRGNPDISRLLNPAAFVGHGDGGFDGMAWKDEQEVLLQQFKSGEVKLLISTSVLEEGLDVPICNLVVRFEGAATLRSFVQSRGRASRRSDSEFVVICTGKEELLAKDLAVREENMKCVVSKAMKDEVSKQQAREFKCQVKQPDLKSPVDEEVKNITYVKRYRPTVTVIIKLFQGKEICAKQLETVTDNLERTFNVRPTTLSPTENIHGLTVGQEEGSTPPIAFTLQQREDNISHEFRSKDEFICSVSDVWCRILEKEEMLNIWLYPLLPQTSRKVEENCTLLAHSLHVGTLVGRSSFQYEWPLDMESVKQVEMRFEHSFNMLTVFFVWRKRNYKLEIRYSELEDFVLVDRKTTDNEMIRAIFTVKHPPRIYREYTDDIDDNDVFADIDDDEDADIDSENEDNNALDVGIDLNLSEVSDSDSERFSTDDEYPDVVRNFRDRPVPRHADADQFWERVVDVRGGSKAWGESFTYCFRIPPKESTLLRSLLTTLDTRFGKKAFYCWIKDTYGRFPEINLPTELDFDVRYIIKGIVTSHPSIRGRVCERRLAELLQGRNPDVVLACLEKLRLAFERDPFCDPQATLEKCLTGEIKFHSTKNQNQIPNHYALIKRVVITPTRVLLHPPEVMVKNRVLRHFESNDDFICVSIREENHSKLSMGRGSIDLILDNINQDLNTGLNIAGTTFHFLAASNSQLRNHSCWFLGFRTSVEEVREWMGDFSQIK